MKPVQTAGAQQQAPLQLLPGGSHSRPPSHPQDAELEALAILNMHHDAIQAAIRPIQESVSDLARDWGTREEAFWERALKGLHPLRAALLDCLDWLAGRLPPGMASNRYQLLIQLGYADSQIDSVGISLTAYRPVCASGRRVHLQQRFEVLADLRELVKRTHQALAQCREMQRRHTQREPARSGHQQEAQEQQYEEGQP